MLEKLNKIKKEKARTGKTRKKKTRKRNIFKNLIRTKAMKILLKANEQKVNRRIKARKSTLELVSSPFFKMWQ